MKKIFTLISAVALSIGAFAQTVNVTYQVDITGYLAAGNTLNANGIRVGGNFSDNGATNVNWSPADPSNAMTDMGNNIWSITIAYPVANVGATQYYKFVNGDWGTNEGTDPANTIATGGCGVDDGSGNINRTLVIPATDATVCFVWDACTSCAASIASNEVSNVVVTPNPANDVVNFNFDLSNAKEATITLFDLTGKEVASTVASASTSLNIEGLGAGTYIYQIKAGDAISTGKVVKK